MTDAAYKAGDDLQKHCQGVDLDALGKYEVCLVLKKAKKKSELSIS